MRFVPVAMTPIPYRTLIEAALHPSGGLVRFAGALNRYLGTVQCSTRTSFMRSIHACLSRLHEASDGRGVVVLPRFSCPTFAHACLAAGLGIRYADVDPSTLAIDLASLEEMDFSDVFALIAVNHFGLTNPMDDLVSIAGRNGFALVEDLGYSLGTEYRDRRLGAFGDYSVLNFKEGKAIPIGGGMLAQKRSASGTTEYPQGGGYGDVLRLFAYKQVMNPRGYYLFTKALRMLGVHERAFSTEDTIVASDDEYEFAFDGTGPLYEISDFQGAVGAAILGRFDAFIAVRERNAAYLRNWLAGCPGVEVASPVEGTTRVHYVRLPVLVRADRRQAVLAGLRCAGIEARAIYAEVKPDPALHPGAARIAREIVTLPCHPGMTAKDLRITATTVRACAGP